MQCGPTDCMARSASLTDVWILACLVAGTFDATAKQTGQLGDDDMWEEINNGKHY